jgi:large subunit ribosomal protein L29
MKISEVRDLSDAEIDARLIDARAELMNLRFQLATGELTDYTRIRYTRQTIARLLTVRTERELMYEPEGES